MKALLKISFAFLAALVSLPLSLVFSYYKSGFASSNFWDIFYGILIYFFPLLFIAIIIIALVSELTDSIKKVYLKKRFQGAIVLIAVFWWFIAWYFHLTNKVLEFFNWCLVLSIALIIYFNLEKFNSSKL